MTVTIRTDVGTTPILVFGSAQSRTSWTIYNASGVAIYWKNTYPSGTEDGFRIPASGSFTLKIPEDNPTQQVWLVAGAGATPIYLYEGYGYA